MRTERRKEVPATNMIHQGFYSEYGLQSAFVFSFFNWDIIDSTILVSGVQCAFLFIHPFIHSLDGCLLGAYCMHQVLSSWWWTRWTRTIPSRGSVSQEGQTRQSVYTLARPCVTLENWVCVMKEKETLGFAIIIGNTSLGMGFGRLFLQNHHLREVSQVGDTASAWWDRTGYMRPVSGIFF